MEKMHFNITIDAPRERVWDILWGEKTYPQWTSVFSPTSTAEINNTPPTTDNWKKGSKVLFLDGDGSGMVSTVADNIPNEYMSFEHQGIVINGVEDTTSEEVKNWAGATENYTLREVNGKTELIIDQDITEDHKQMFEEMWPKALNTVKQMAEKNAVTS